MAVEWVAPTRPHPRCRASGPTPALERLGLGLLILATVLLSPACPAPVEDDDAGDDVGDDDTTPEAPCSDVINLELVVLDITDGELRDHAETPGDGFEVILQANGTPVPVSGEYQGEPAEICFPERVLANPAYADLELLDPPCVEHDKRDFEVPAASWHQKFWLIDDRVAYVGGMNTKSTDWDSNEHLVFDPRRMDFDASTAEREAVLDREELPDLGPRKDYVIRIAGPCVTDVDDVFATRWEEARASGAAYSENTTPLVPQGYGGGLTGDAYAQVVATMPEPWAEMSILESMAKAVANAESYIYIEDQYWRAPVLNDAIIETLLQRPWVKLIVVTKQVSSLDGGAKYTYLTDQLFRDLVPDQYLLIQLKSFDVVAEEGWIWDTRELYVQDIDVHSKITIVDDRYLAVGSANKNNRGFLFEGELDVAVLDDTLARDARERIFRNLVGPALASQVGDDADANFALLQATAAANEALVEDWEVWIDELDVDDIQDLAASYRPDGFVYPLTTRDEWLLDVGPDLF